MDDQQAFFGFGFLLILLKGVCEVVRVSVIQSSDTFEEFRNRREIRGDGFGLRSSERTF